MTSIDTVLPEATLPQTPRTRAVRMGDRGSHDRALIQAIIDEAPICHIGFVDDAIRGHGSPSPVVIPTVPWRVGDELMIHGASSSRMIRRLQDGGDACVTISLIDGWVLARSAFHHSVNYRSVMLFGRPRLVAEETEKRAALDALMEKIEPGRSGRVRAPNPQELKATAVLAFPIAEASAKRRSGPPSDDVEDLSHPVWAGVVPLRLVAGEPERDPAQGAAQGPAQGTVG
ncbi:pyridoxamine 5'-phosphate oxidase family protein [Azospirillum picis]|uniref:Nitroimidazol reductase NimA-like FMN-containing flavoprotein (Pyridoxamine 5'-phosphate oxidase superfamily) n=1 Tax=Azospirillum picis TaxID=488438 RepID=A0ABU0MT39_9PROT|nr:pyridoxamine 5'-phosphate oxidase family protein [Azospirillum picis]MBP2302860.1 nitroimidazol reductase NimA-like FMN-containing flavoprotein (pyridoxamine 5'-phosphate oxidase superfamily) [Azospirillum picis]MDQ0536635.1 nitroimidazol reductase NimA-like FMN-containing flavoprotein (pyridoxamine 5'-phosphate oxidase superfamily) [Azospirillum picis]